MPFACSLSGKIYECSLLSIAVVDELLSFIRAEGCSALSSTGECVVLAVSSFLGETCSAGIPP